jgi:multicomponent Na+:H+ antiporter subunit E
MQQLSLRGCSAEEDPRDIRRFSAASVVGSHRPSIDYDAMSLALNTAILFALWLVFTGTFAPLYLAAGLVASLVIAVNFARWDDGTRFRLLPFIRFLPWLAWQIIRSNLRIARIVLSPRMPIHPTFISQPPGVRGSRAVTTLGAGITLTPGTLTVDASEQEILVHSLDSAFADDVRAGVMARHLASVFTDAGT